MKTITKDMAKNFFKKMLENKDYIESTIRSGKPLDKDELKRRGIKPGTNVVPLAKGS